MELRQKETLYGAVVIAALAVFVAYSYSQKGHTSSSLETYNVLARFGQTDGLYTGATVRVSGVDVGQVVSMELNEHYRATVTIRLPTGVQLPLDSSASIRSDGLIGSKYIELEPGGELDMLGDGDAIDYTQDAVVVEELLTKIIDMAKSRRDPAKALPSDDEVVQ